MALSHHTPCCVGKYHVRARVTTRIASAVKKRVTGEVVTACSYIDICMEERNRISGVEPSPCAQEGVFFDEPTQYRWPKEFGDGAFCIVIERIGEHLVAIIHHPHIPVKPCVFIYGKEFSLPAGEGIVAVNQLTSRVIVNLLFGHVVEELFGG